MSHEQDIKTSLLWLLGFFGTAIVLVLIFVMVVIYYRTESRLEYERRISQPYAELETALEDQRIRLVEYGIVNTIEENGKTRNVYQIPIDEAMRLVQAEWESGQRPGPPPPVGSAGQAASAPETTPPADAEETQGKPSPEAAESGAASGESPEANRGVEDQRDERS